MISLAKDENGDNTQNDPVSIGLMILAILQFLMLAALYTQTEPHPPLRVAPFALAPFISVAIALAVTGWMMREGTARTLVALTAAVLALVSYGPHKWFDPAIGDIWPAIVLSQIAIALVLYGSIGKLMQKRN